MIGQSAFCGGQNIIALVIVAPFRVSKSSRVLTKLTADSQTHCLTKVERAVEIPVHKLHPPNTHFVFHMSSTALLHPKMPSEVPSIRGDRQIDFLV
jgi:hypothetical protein